jgi:hypothetical protein
MFSSQINIYDGRRLPHTLSFQVAFTSRLEGDNPAAIQVVHVPSLTPLPDGMLELIAMNS